MKQVFVTGGSGFVGGNLIDELVSRGITVHALARSDQAAEKVEARGAVAVRGDLESITALKKGMDGCDTVFHAGAVVTLWGDPDEFQRINVQGTQNVVTAARMAGVSTLVHVSTEAVLAGGPPIVDADEMWDYPRKPCGLYPTTKGAAERIVIQSNAKDLKTVAIRPPLIWGKGDTSVLPQIAAAVENGQWMWFDGGHYPHTTTHVKNVVEGLILAAEKGRGGQVYFLSDGEPMDFREFITRSLATMGVTPSDKAIPWWLASIFATVTESIWVLLRLKSDPPLPRSVLYVMGQKLTVNDSKARIELGYEGRVSIEDGLAEMTAD